MSRLLFSLGITTPVRVSSLQGNSGGMLVVEGAHLSGRTEGERGRGGVIGQKSIGWLC